MVKIKDIATATGLAISTVSSVLNNKEYCYVSAKKRKLIIDTADKLGYIPNMNSRALQGLPTRTIGIIGSIFPEHITGHIIEALVRELEANNYSTMLANSYSDSAKEEKIIREFLARGVDGFILNSRLPSQKINDLLHGRSKYVNFNTDIEGCVSVDLDRYSGAIEAVEHLIEIHSCRKIAFLGSSSNHEKIQGYRAALTKHGIKDEFLLNIVSHQDVEKHISEIKHNKIDAIFASNDFIAAYIMKFMKRHGFMLPVIGFDGLDYICEMLDPSIKSVKHSPDKVAKKTVDLLRKLLEDEDVEIKQYYIKPELNNGKSCGCT